MTNHKRDRNELIKWQDLINAYNAYLNLPRTNVRLISGGTRVVVTLILAVAIVLIYWFLHSQLSQLHRESEMRRASQEAIARGTETQRASQEAMAPSSPPKGPPLRSSVRTAPGPRPDRKNQKKTQREPGTGNTDGGHLPWNGWDLYGGDYSPKNRQF